MAVRPTWKGNLRLSLVSCPIELYPATTSEETVSFNQLNRRTGNRIRYKKVDAGTGEPVESGDIIKGYQVEKDTYIPVTPEEIDAVQIESRRSIDIDQFVPAADIDPLYLDNSYFIAPSGADDEAQAFVIIREALKKEKVVALGRIVMTNREHVVALQPRGRGLLGTLLRYPYELRKPEQYFGAVPEVEIPKDMMDLAIHLVKTKEGRFDPKLFKDRYQDALKAMIEKKRAGQPLRSAPETAPARNVINLMDALKRSVGSVAPKAGAKPPKAKKRIEGQREMLLPIAGKKEPAKESARKASAKAPGRRKAG